MVKLRSKLHLSRHRQRSSLSHTSCPVECNPAVPTQPAGTPSMSGPAELPSLSLPGQTLGPLPEELLIRVASFCDLSDLLRLRRSSRALHYSFGRTSVIEQVLIQLVSPSSKSSQALIHKLHSPRANPPKIWGNPVHPPTWSLTFIHYTRHTVTSRGMDPAALTGRRWLLRWTPFRRPTTRSAEMC